MGETKYAIVAAVLGLAALATVAVLANSDAASPSASLYVNPTMASGVQAASQAAPVAVPQAAATAEAATASQSRPVFFAFGGAMWALLTGGALMSLRKFFQAEEGYEYEQLAMLGYVPDGLTAEQYAKLQAEEKKKDAAARKKFPKGKKVETLTEWMNACEKKGLSGKNMNLKGHRMVKAKYDDFYTDESPI